VLAADAASTRQGCSLGAGNCQSDGLLCLLCPKVRLESSSLRKVSAREEGARTSMAAKSSGSALPFGQWLQRRIARRHQVERAGPLTRFSSARLLTTHNTSDDPS
jgi:hypothetical protein